MQKNTNAPEGKEKITVNNDKPNAAVTPTIEKSKDVHKHEVEEEVKESFKDENVDAEPALGNDGDEVGGEG